MIVDCHTHIWDAAADRPPLRAEADATLCADASRWLEVGTPVDLAIVLGFKSAYLDQEISNRFVAECVQKHASKLIGFAGIDPTLDSALDELDVAHNDLRLKGITVAPSLQDFHPSDTRAMRVYSECARLRLPVLFEQSPRNPAAKMEFARPLLLDEVAREFPDLRLVIAHMGYPFVSETIALLGKHRHVYADISGLLPHPWLSYNALVSAFEYGVMDKLLFGSDFPYRSPAACIEALYSVNQVSYGANLVTIPREHLRRIVERDALRLLGIEHHAAQRRNGATLADEP